MLVSNISRGNVIMAAADAIAMAFRNYAAGNLSVAEQFSIAVLKDEPNHAESLHLLGLIAKQRGNLTQAIDFLNRSFACNDADAETWKHLGDAQLIANHCRAAVTNYEQALRLQPNFAEAYNNLGLAFQQLGDSERAAEVLRQALRLVPSFASAHNNLGIVLKSQGKLTVASEAFEQAVRLQPDFSEFAYNLARREGPMIDSLTERPSRKRSPPAAKKSSGKGPQKPLTNHPWRRGFKQ